MALPAARAPSNNAIEQLFLILPRPMELRTDCRAGWPQIIVASSSLTRRGEPRQNAKRSPPPGRPLARLAGGAVAKAHRPEGGGFRHPLRATSNITIPTIGPSLTAVQLTRNALPSWRISGTDSCF